MTFDTNNLSVFTLDVKYGDSSSITPFVILAIALAVFMLIGIALHQRVRRV